MTRRPIADSCSTAPNTDRPRTDVDNKFQDLHNPIGAACVICKAARNHDKNLQNYGSFFKKSRHLIKSVKVV